MKQLSQEAQRLSTSYFESSTHIAARESQAVTAWRELNAKSQRRKQKLEQAEELQYYLNDFRDLRCDDWCSTLNCSTTQLALSVCVDPFKRPIGGYRVGAFSSIKYRYA